MSSIQNSRGSRFDPDPPVRFAKRPDRQADRGNLGGHPVQVVPRSRRPEPESAESAYYSAESAYYSAESASYSSASSRPLGSRRASVVAVPVNTEMAQAARDRALPTRDQLIAKAGRPKDDITFLGLTIHRMSTGYKALLEGLDGYHDALNSDQRVTRDQLEGLLGHLQTLSEGADRYVKRSSHTRISEINDLKDQIDDHIDLLEGVLQQVEEGAAWHRRVSLRDGIDFARRGVDVKGFRAEALRPYRDLGLSRAEARMLHRRGLGLDEARMYRDVNLPVTRETLLDPDFRSSNETASKVLGSGAFNTVYKVTYSNGAVGAVKPLPRIDGRVVEKGWVANKIGIDPRNPQNALRNVATVAVARKLGFDVVPVTRIAEHGGRLGILMGMAPGKTAKEIRKTNPDLFRNAEVRRAITKLQLLDALTGQGDRHRGNYFIHIGPDGRVTVTGIDNDQCFGHKVRNPNDIAHDPNYKAEGSSQSDGFHGVRLPPVVDTEMAAAFDRLTPEDLNDLLGDMLSPDEVDAANRRLRVIQNHINNLRTSNCVIASTDWGSEAVSRRLTPENSYVARDGRPIDLRGPRRPAPRAPGAGGMSSSTMTRRTSA
jgi:hypothetical protein